jgi:hypothetical protein
VVLVVRVMTNRMTPAGPARPTAPARAGAPTGPADPNAVVNRRADLSAPATRRADPNAVVIPRVDPNAAVIPRVDPSAPAPRTALGPTSAVATTARRVGSALVAPSR